MNFVFKFNGIIAGITIANMRSFPGPVTKVLLECVPFLWEEIVLSTDYLLIVSSPRLKNKPKKMKKRRTDRMHPVQVLYYSYPLNLI